MARLLQQTQPLVAARLGGQRLGGGPTCPPPPGRRPAARPRQPLFSVPQDQVPQREHLGAGFPLCLALPHLLVGHERLLQPRADGGLVHVAADEDHLLAPVAVWCALVLLPHAGRPLGRVHSAVQPPRAGLDAHGDARLAPDERLVRRAGHPDDALGAQDAVGAAALQQHHARLVEGPLRAEHEAGDAILLRLRHVVAGELLDPAGHALGLGQVEAASVHQQLQVHLAEGGAHDLGLRVQPPQHALQARDVRLGYQVRLVEHHDVRALELLD
mmetsp:Transcript_54119/g.167536  ORF Transcript_54119/g.167536 Transcript_54119/m.167536 type:complete len:272 (-) Transcript_54119:592-1407(-)